MRKLENQEATSPTTASRTTPPLLRSSQILATRPHRLFPHIHKQSEYPTTCLLMPTKLGTAPCDICYCSCRRSKSFQDHAHWQKSKITEARALWLYAGSSACQRLGHLRNPGHERDLEIWSLAFQALSFSKVCYNWGWNEVKWANVWDLPQETRSEVEKPVRGYYSDLSDRGWWWWWWWWWLGLEWKKVKVLKNGWI